MSPQEGFCNLKTSHPHRNLSYPLSIEVSRQDCLGSLHWHGPCPWTECQHRPALPCSQACHAPSPLPGPCCRARLFLLIHALELWGRGLELGTKFRHGGAGRQPGIHTRCTRNAQAECLAFKSLGEAAHPPCPYLPPLQPLVPCPLLIVPGASADLPNSRPPLFLTLPQM